MKLLKENILRETCNSNQNDNGKKKDSVVDEALSEWFTFITNCGVRIFWFK